MDGKIIFFWGGRWRAAARGLQRRLYERRGGGFFNHEWGAALPQILPRLGWLAEPSEFRGEAAFVSSRRRLRRLGLGSARASGS